MIPVRVPVDAPTWTVGGERRLGTSHPLYNQPCPVCDVRLGVAAITLVLVGMLPEDREESGWTIGAAVAVHLSCTAPNSVSEADRRPAAKIRGEADA